MKVGIVINSSGIGFYQYQFIEKLNSSPVFEVILINLLHQGDTNLAKSNKRDKDNNNSNRFELKNLVLKFQKKVELCLIQRIIKESRYFRTHSIKDLGIKNQVDLYWGLNSDKKEFFVSPQNNRIIRDLDLDVILSINTPYLVSDGNHLSRIGSFSFCKYAVSDTIESISGFWETYFSKPSTGFSLYCRPADEKKPYLVFNGNVTTKNLCWQYNYHFLQLEKYKYLFRYLNRLAHGSDASKIDPPNKRCIDEKKIPEIRHFLNYYRILMRETLKKIKNHLLNLEDYWTVHYSKSSNEDINIAKTTKILNPKGRYFADPFILNYNNRDILFVEEYIGTEKKAVISAIEILSDSNYMYLGEVLREVFHLSYPYVFEYRDNLYMIPESSNALAIRLYKCVEFPLRWEYQYDLISDIDAADTTMHYDNDKYWLFTNRKESCGEFNSILDCYFSDSPISKSWESHLQNPVLINNGARNGGFLYNKGFGTIISQSYGLNIYGKSIEINQVKTLSPNEFSLVKVKEITTDNIPGIMGAKGVHHLCSNDRYTCFDTLQHKKISSKEHH